MASKAKPTCNTKIVITPRTHRQAEYLELINSNYITFCVGPAGCGKTFLACLQAMKDLQDGSIRKIVLVRPSVTAGEDIGFLPGSLEEKMDPFMAPLYDAFNEYWQDQLIEDYIADGTIEIVPLAFMRGRAEPVSSLIPTPTGHKRMGDLKVGDEVYGRDGKVTKVTGVFPQGIVPVADVYFRDGSVVRCSKNHLWDTRTQSQRHRGQKFTTKTTEEIQRTLRSKHGQRNHEVPTITSPVEFPRIEVPIDPYLLGCLLGDGTISSGSIQFTTSDLELVTLIQDRLPSNVSIKPNKSSITGYDYYITKDSKAIPTNPLKEALRNLGVWGKTSSNKEVPELYLYNDSDTRLEVLRGLMDTDGSIFLHRKRNDTMRMEFYSTSTALANNVKFLVESLGGTAKIRVKEVAGSVSSTGLRYNHDINVVTIHLPETINPFRLSRKSEKFNPSPVIRLIDNVIDAGEEECQCISVDSPDHLYLTGSFVVTHNTFRNAFIIADEAQNTTKDQMKMLLTRFGDDCRMVIAGDISQNDLKHFQQSGLKAGVHLAKWGVTGMSYFEFGVEDVVRHPVVRDILDGWESLNLDD